VESHAYFLHSVEIKVFGDSIISNLIGGCKCRFGWESSLNDNVFFDITPSYNQVTKTFCV